MPKVEEIIDADQFERDIAYSMSDLDTAVAQQAGFSAYYGAKLAQAKRKAGKMKIALKTIEAQAYLDIREAAAIKKAKMTENQISACVDINEKVISARAAHANALYYEDLGMAATEAFRHRRDMLKEHGMNARTEQFSDPSIVRKEVEKGVLEQMKKSA